MLLTVGEYKRLLAGKGGEFLVRSPGKNAFLGSVQSSGPRLSGLPPERKRNEKRA